jgi:phosphatidate cytidylyltransferase
MIYCALAAFTVAMWSHFDADQTMGTLGIMIFMAVLFGEMMFNHVKVRFEKICICLVAGILVPYLMTSLIRILDTYLGRYTICIPFILAFLPDSGAYFAGRFFGRHKLIVEISPKKTVEGSVGGIVFCVLAFLLFGFIVGKTVGVTPNYLALSLSAIPISIIAQIGDLVFSLIKREHNVKDYGNIFPGHGGMLDRIDSIIPVAILLYILVSVGGGFAFFV